MEKPKRKYELSLTISGDLWTDVVQQLRMLLPHIEDHGEQCDSVSGGYSGGHTVQLTVNPEQTHDKFAAELDAYLEARKGAEA